MAQLWKNYLELLIVMNNWLDKKADMVVNMRFLFFVVSF